MNSKTIKGQAWISPEGQLLQDQVLILENGTTCNNTVALIADIWEDLLSENSTVKSNGKGYFYWDVKMTDFEDDSREVSVFIEAPRPKEGLFEEPLDEDDYASEWAKYWVARIKRAQENANNKMTVQKKEITFAGTQYVDYSTGETVTVNETKYTNSDIGDISNLLSMF